MRFPRRLAVLACATLLAGCEAEAPAPPWLTIEDVTPAFLAERHAMHVALAADASGRAALTFVTKSAQGLDLWLSLSSDSGRTFGAPRRMNEGGPRVTSFAEGRPIAAFGPGGRLALAWSQREPGQDMAANLMVRASGDGGATFGPPVRVNDDLEGRPCFHGFATLSFRPDGSLFAAWMDERNNPPVEGEPSSGELFASLSHDGGQHWTPNRAVTDRLCPCCRASAVTASGNMVAIAYRSAGHDLRDPALAISNDGGASFAFDTLFSADRWQLAGCPAIGPAITAQRPDGGDLAWYTEGGGRAVYVAPWRVGLGIAGLKRAVNDSLLDAGHPRMVPLGDASLLAVEARTRADSTHTRFAVRALDPDGRMTPWAFLGADVMDGWLTAQGSRTALACWSDREGDGRRPRVVRLTRTR